MLITKRQLVEDAFSEIGLAAYVYDLSPGMLERGLRIMDSLVADWDSNGLRFGYPLNDSSDLDDECSIPDSSVRAIVLNTAVDLAPGHGKQVMPKTLLRAKSTYNSLLRTFGRSVPEKQPSYMPSGAGSKPGRTYDEFLPSTSQSFQTGDDEGPVL